MDDQKPDDNKKPWFGPKRFGVGIRPSSWQGWFIIVIALIAEIIIVSAAPELHPSWFAVKTIGTGFTPATWQGWAVTLVPPLIIVIAVRYLYKNQNKQ